jgi:hypothetical protein
MTCTSLQIIQRENNKEDQTGKFSYEMSTAASENGMYRLRDSHNPTPGLSAHHHLYTGFYQNPNGLIGLSINSSVTSR